MLPEPITPDLPSRPGNPIKPELPRKPGLKLEVKPWNIPSLKAWIEEDVRPETPDSEILLQILEEVVRVHTSDSAGYTKIMTVFREILDRVEWKDK